MEGQFLADVAQRRWPVLIFIVCFDVFCYMLRLGARLVTNVRFGLVDLAAEMGPQLANMGFCYLFLGLVNTRSRRGGGIASRQVSSFERKAGILAHAVRQTRPVRTRAPRMHPRMQPITAMLQECSVHELPDLRRACPPL